MFISVFIDLNIRLIICRYKYTFIKNIVNYKTDLFHIYNILYIRGYLYLQNCRTGDQSNVDSVLAKKKVDSEAQARPRDFCSNHPSALGGPLTDTEVQPRACSFSWAERADRWALRGPALPTTALVGKEVNDILDGEKVN